MAVLQQFKCPCCDGAIEFDSSVQKMKCPYCDSEFEMDSLKALEAEQENLPPERMDWDAAGCEWQEGEADGLRIYCCDTCGGEIVADETTGAAACPFCGNPVVMKGQFSGDLKPDLVIPFKYDKKAAVEALHRHYKGKVLLPRVFKDENHISEVKGVYVPVWLFDGDADAHVQYRASRVRRWISGRYQYTETSHYLVTRAGSLGFENVPVDGSTKMDDALMESIEPFDISGAVDFRTAYLAGYLADRYDVSANASIARANERIQHSTQQTFASTVTGYSSVVPSTTRINLRNSRSRYALYPVWILNTKWNGKQFTFAMNGQTGKIAGDLPMDRAAFRRWLFGVGGAVGAAVFLLRYLLWLL